MGAAGEYEKRQRTLLAAKLSAGVLDVLYAAGPAFWADVEESATLQNKIENRIHEDLKDWRIIVET